MLILIFTFKLLLFWHILKLSKLAWKPDILLFWASFSLELPRQLIHGNQFHHLYYSKLEIWPHHECYFYILKARSPKYNFYCQRIPHAKMLYPRHCEVNVHFLTSWNWKWPKYPSRCRHQLTLDCHLRVPVRWNKEVTFCSQYWLAVIICDHCDDTATYHQLLVLLGQLLIQQFFFWTNEIEFQVLKSSKLFLKINFLFWKWRMCANSGDKGFLFISIVIA